MDNAKELILAKINSGIDLANLYIYSTMLGIDFNTIGELMISDTVDSINTLSKTNMFGYINNMKLSSALLTLKRGYYDVKQFLGKRTDADFNALYNIFYNAQQGRNIDGKIVDMEIAMQEAQETMGEEDFAAMLEAQQDYEDYEDQVSDDEFYAMDTADDFKNTGIAKLNKFLRDSSIDDLRIVYKTLSDLEMQARLGKAEHFTNSNNLKVAVFRMLQKHIELKAMAADKQVLNTFYELNKDARDVTNLSHLLAINGGKMTTIEEKIFFMDMLKDQFPATLVKELRENESGTIDKIVKNLGIKNPALFARISQEGDPTMYVQEKVAALFNAMGDGYFDPIQFLLNQNYQDAVIGFTNLTKNVFNLLDVITNVPHYRGMFETFAVEFAQYYNNSVKFRKLYDLYSANKYSLQSFDSDASLKSRKLNLITQLSSYLDQLLIYKWLADKQFTIEEGTKYFDEKHQLQVADTTLTFDLDTVDNKATFKHWFENVVVPNLKDGYINDSRTKTNLDTKENALIRDLILISSNKSITRDEFPIYTLPINMTNLKSTNDQMKYASYENGMQELRSVKYNGIPVVDLFYIYNLMQYDNKGGQNSFTKLFDYFIEYDINPLINSFTNYIADIDYEAMNDADLDPYNDFNSGYLKMLLQERVLDYSTRKYRIKDQYGNRLNAPTDINLIAYYKDFMLLTGTATGTPTVNKLMNQIYSGNIILESDC